MGGVSVLWIDAWNELRCGRIGRDVSIHVNPNAKQGQGGAGDRDVGRNRDRNNRACGLVTAM